MEIDKTPTQKLSCRYSFCLKHIVAFVREDNLYKKNLKVGGYSNNYLNVLSLFVQLQLFQER